MEKDVIPEQNEVENEVIRAYPQKVKHTEIGRAQEIIQELLEKAIQEEDHALGEIDQLKRSMRYETVDQLQRRKKKYSALDENRSIEALRKEILREAYKEKHVEQQRKKIECLFSIQEAMKKIQIMMDEN